MPLPLVSYIIITMNRSDELADCLANVREQDYPHKEIIVVDNGSTDDTREAVSNNFPEVRYIYLENNLGVSGGRNKGTVAAQGEICIFLDDDARFTDPAATAKAVEYFQNDTRLACLAFTIRNAFTGIEDYKAIPRIDKKQFDQDYPCTYFCGAGFALRRQVFLELGAGLFLPPARKRLSAHALGSHHHCPPRSAAGPAQRAVALFQRPQQMLAGLAEPSMAVCRFHDGVMVGAYGCH